MSYPFSSDIPIGGVRDTTPFLPNLNHPLNQGLVSWWKVLPNNYGTNKFIDIIGQNHGSLIGMSNANNGYRSTSHQGGYGSLLFDGTAGLVSTPSPLSSSYFGPISISFFVRYIGNGSSSYPIFFSQSSTGGVNSAFEIGFDVITNKLFFASSGGFSSSYGVNDGKWHQIFLTTGGYGFAVNLYFDGAYRESSTAFNCGGYTGKICIGSLFPSTSPTLFANVMMDDVKIYNYALTLQQVQQDYQLSLQGYPGVLTPSVPKIKYFTPPLQLASHTGYKEPQTPLVPNLNHPLNQGLISWWKVLPNNYGTNKLIDIIGQNHGNLVGMSNPNSGWRPQSHPGGFGSLLFGGGYVSVPSYNKIIDLPVFTIGGTFAFASFPAVQFMMEKANPSAAGNDNFYLWWNGSQIVYGFHSSSGYQDSLYTASLTAGIPYQILFSYDGTTSRLYINGLLAASNVATGPPDTSNLQSLALGASHNGSTTNFFSGWADDIKIYNYALTAQQVQQDYQLSLQGYPGVLTSRKTTSYQTVPKIYGGTKRSLKGKFLPNLNHPLNQGLISWWKVLPNNYGSGKFIDIIGQNHGNLVGMSNSNNGYRSQSHPGGLGSVQFDGTNGNVNIGTGLSFAGTDYSISSWVFDQSTAGYPSLVNKGDGATNTGSQYEMLAGFGGDKKFSFDVFIGGNNQRCVAPSAHNLNQWYHVCGTRIGSLSSLYVDGVLIATGTFAGAANSTTNATRWGCPGTGPSSVLMFGGKMDDMKMWNRGLNVSEVYTERQLSLQGYPGVLIQDKPNNYYQPQGNNNMWFGA